MTTTATSIQDDVVEIFERGDRGDFDEGLLSVRELSVHFGGLLALENVSCDVGAGQVVAIIGPNGAGKTTLLNTICGLTTAPSSGRVIMGQRDVLGMGPAKIAGLGLGRSFQNPPLIEDATAMDNVRVGGHRLLTYRMADQLWRRSRVRQQEDALSRDIVALLNFMGLERVMELPVSDLSYGTRKLIDIARALVSAPRVVLLDEPTSGLDRNEQLVVKNLLLELRANTKLGFLVVEHHMDVVRAVSDQVVGLQAGSVLAIGTAAEVLDSETFREAVVSGRHDKGSSDSTPPDVSSADKEEA